MSQIETLTLKELSSVQCIVDDLLFFSSPILFLFGYLPMPLNCLKSENLLGFHRALFILFHYRSHYDSGTRSSMDCLLTWFSDALIRNRNVVAASFCMPRRTRE
jgi:hypothetical protein